MVRRVVLVGLMGSGKTTIGTGLARTLGWPYVDSDEQVERATGASARAVRDAQGTDALHRAEAGALLAALAMPGRVVIGAAASAVEDAACRAALAAPDILLVWLWADPAILAGRFAERPDRPAYGAQPAAFLAAQAALRNPVFEALAGLEIDTGTTSPDAAIDLVLTLLCQPGGSSSPRA